MSVFVETVPPLAYTVRGRWEDPLGLSYRIEADGGPLEPALFERLVHDAVAAWNDTGLVRMSPAPEGAEPHFFLRWGAAASADNPGGFGHDTSVAMTGPVEAGTFVAFDPERAWQEGQGEGASFSQAVLHELGHVLGLGHSSWSAALMYSAREFAASEIGPADLAGLEALYGEASGSVGDWVVDGRLAVRGTPALAESSWGIFDTDGDGDDELMVWSHRREDRGAWQAFHFARAPEGPSGPGRIVLERTVGPMANVADAAGMGDARALGVVEDGARFLYVERSAEVTLRLEFDSRGRPLRPEQAEPVAFPRPAPSLEGDLDGDGILESIARLEHL